MPQSISRIVLQRGVVLTPTADRSTWVAHASVRGGSVALSLEEWDSLQLRPVLADLRHTEDYTSPFLVPTSPDQFQAPVVGTLAFGRFFNNAHHVDYLLGAIPYHFGNLTRCYGYVCDRYRQTTLIPNFGAEREALFSGNPEPYYEVDAFLGVARRAYSALSVLLCQVYKAPRGVEPRDFPAVVKAIPDLDPGLRARLSESWVTMGAVVKDYRDCVHHYAALGLALSPIHVSRLERDVCAASAWLPDNPKSRSRRHFTYKEHHDALDLAWRAASEIRAIATLVLAEARKVAA